jgi:hypothetical protein
MNCCCRQVRQLFKHAARSRELRPCREVIPVEPGKQPAFEFPLQGSHPPGPGMSLCRMPGMCKNRTLFCQARSAGFQGRQRSPSWRTPSRSACATSPANPGFSPGGDASSTRAPKRALFFDAHAAVAAVPLGSVPRHVMRWAKSASRSGRGKAAARKIRALRRSPSSSAATRRRSPHNGSSRGKPAPPYRTPSGSRPPCPGRLRAMRSG